MGGIIFIIFRYANKKSNFKKTTENDLAQIKRELHAIKDELKNK